MYSERIGKRALSGFLCLWLLFAVASAECDKTQCPGPLRFYWDLNCKPIYKNSDDCCPVRYDCDHLLARSPDKCYANGNEYAIGERLKKEDSLNPCDMGCHCIKDYKGVVRFSCAIVDCFPTEPKPGCYFKRQLDSCCHLEEICPENPEDRLKCEVHGKTYLDGDQFYVREEDNFVCQCTEGFKGQTVSPFCRKTTCGVELKRPLEIRKKCAPIYENNQSLSTTCNWAFRCQDENDTIIHPENENPSETHSEQEMCQYGNMKLHIGDELSQSTVFPNECVKCVCDTPPALTCQRLSNEECKIKYPRQT